MAEPQARRKAATGGQSAARPRSRQVAPIDERAQDRSANGWLEQVTSMVQAPFGIGRTQAERLVGDFDRFVENRIEDVLNRVNIPSRSDIERLNRSVDVLTAKVEALLSRQERSGR